jgi:hypothetical protein
MVPLGCANEIDDAMRALTVVVGFYSRYRESVIGSRGRWAPADEGLFFGRVKFFDRRKTLAAVVYWYEEQVPLS